MKAIALLVFGIIQTLGAESAHAQTAEQLRSEGAFVRAVIRARDAGDCRLALRLVVEREAVLRSQALKTIRTKDRTADADKALSYLMVQIEGLQHRRDVLSRECR